jgi:hypothetical protein
MPSKNIKAGDKVSILDYKEIPRGVVAKLKRRKYWIVRKVKPSGGILLEDIEIGWQCEEAGGKEQGLMPHRLNKVK